MRVERESINFKLPKPLADALRGAAKERGTTATDLVIQGLHQILEDAPGVEVSTEIRLQKIEENLQQLWSNTNGQGKTTKTENAAADSHTEARLTKIEEKLETINNRVAQLEGALIAIQRNGGASNNRQRYRYSGNPYNQSGRPPQMQPLSEEKLAWRLNIDAATLQEKRTTLTQEEFLKWSKDHDSRYKWRFNSNDGLYHPVEN
ncbi:MAG: hypothetical protein KI793_26680 [Rivularia sp. (in: Bacteria)]|nr:hypothetical protein [Rivularia sp. MS3]